MGHAHLGLRAMASTALISMRYRFFYFEVPFEVSFLPRASIGLESLQNFKIKCVKYYYVILSTK